MSQTTLPLVSSHHPTTFLERGVSVPFTTPMLLGARARPSDRGGLELIVANPSGGRGTYILPWSGVSRLCRPTVHDIRLYGCIAERQAITPVSIRAAAQAVATQGLAGRDAAVAAAAAQAEEVRDRLSTNFLLMVAAIRQTDPTGIIDEMEVVTRHPALQQRAKYSIDIIAPRLGRTSEAVFKDLEQLAGVLTPIGLDQQDPPARVPRLLDAIKRFRTAAQQWGRDHLDNSGAQATLAAAIAGVTIDCAESTLADARASTNDVTSLLKEWNTSPEPVARRLARTEWLVDGWEQICLMWESTTSTAERRVAMAELAWMVPILPKEVTAWMSRQVATDVPRGIAKIVPALIDWRSGMYFNRVARNEHLRALAV